MNNNTAPMIPWSEPDLGQEELDEITDSFRNNWLTSGPKVEKLEQNLARFLNVPYAIAISNGTVALDLILKNLDIVTNDEVIVPALTYFATASAVSYQGATPVFVDVHPQTLNLDPDRIEEALTTKTKAIFFIDYGGNPAHIDEISFIGKKHGIPVVQDAAQSLGGIYKGNPLGAQTEISSLSFHMAKIMTTVEGGMIFTHNPDVYQDLLSRRNQGETAGQKYRHVVLGTNARMTDLQAGIGLAQFKKLDRFIEARRNLAKIYDESFMDLHKKISLINSTPIENSQNAYFLYTILTENRDALADTLRKKYGIDTRVAYPMPVYQQVVYKNQKYPSRHINCPIAEKQAKKILNLPIYPKLSKESIERIVHAIRQEIH